MMNRNLLRVAMNRALEQGEDYRVVILVQGFVGLGLNGTREKSYTILPTNPSEPKRVGENQDFVGAEIYDEYMELTHKGTSLHAEPYTTFIKHDKILEVRVISPYKSR